MTIGIGILACVLVIGLLWLLSAAIDLAEAINEQDAP